MLVDSLIADNMFQQIIQKPGSFKAIIAPNLNGDYISDAAAAMV
jgi:isocitrate dehydrogenase